MFNLKLLGFILLISGGISAQTSGLLMPASYPDPDSIINLNLKKTRGKIITWERFFTASLCFGSGASNGIHEIINYKYHKFKGVHPNANDQYFNPQLSHTNKWKGGDIRNGEKFFLSSTAFVSLTDFKHALGFIQKNLLVGAIVINIGQPLKKWYIYALEFIAYSASWSVGFHTTYSLLYGGMRP